MSRTALLLVVGALAAGCGSDPPPPAPVTLSPPPFAGDGTVARCEKCHPEQSGRWRGSGHRVAVRPIDAVPAAEREWTAPLKVTEGLGPHPVDIGLRDGELWCRSTDAAGTPTEYRITHMIGGRDRSRYLTALPPDDQAWGLPLEFDHRTDKFRPFWAPDEARQPTPVHPSDPRYWHGRQENFSAICFRCHTPLTKFDYDPATDRYTVDWGRPDETGVQCTACHGDARQHAASAERGDPVPILPPIDPLPNERAPTELGSCGRCHFTGEVLAPGYRPGQNYFDAHQPVVLDDSARFWPDGLRKQEAYSLLAHSLSSCFQRGGLRCDSCHDPHGDRDRDEVRYRAIHACSGCHTVAELPTSCSSHDAIPVTKDSDPPDCVQCHMQRIPTIKSARTMHDHRVLAPDPGLTRMLGIPNACGRCHGDSEADTQRMEAAVIAWGATPRTRRAWALILNDGLAGKPEAAGALRDLVLDTTPPWPIPATAARLLGRYPSPETATVLEKAVREAADPMVRSGAAYGLVSQPGDGPTQALRDALGTEQVLAPRLMIATALVVRGDEQSRDAAMAVIRGVVDTIPDDVALRRLLAYGWQSAGKLDEALAEYARALKLSPHDEAIAAAEAHCRTLAEKAKANAGDGTNEKR
ncbi:MAG: multiheme c-type cytochrome [Planctomycetota bacterium]